MVYDADVNRSFPIRVSTAETNRTRALGFPHSSSMESPPPLPRYIPQKSKKRVFPGGSSSSHADPDGSKSQIEVVHQEEIDIEMYEDSGDVIVFDEKADKHNNKGKEAVTNFSGGYSNLAKPGSVSGVQFSEKSSAPWPHNSFNVEGFSHDFSYGDDEYMDIYHDDLTHDDKYAYLQAHFDSMDIPPGVEAPIPWFSDPAQNKNNPATVSSSNYSSFPIQFDAPGTDSLHSLGVPELAQTRNKSIATSSSISQTQMDHPSQPYSVELYSSGSFPKSANNERKLAASTSSIYSSSQTEMALTNLPSGYMPAFSYSKRKPAVSGSTTNYTSHNQPDTMKPSSGMGLSFKGSNRRNRLKKLLGNGSLTDSRSSAMDAMDSPPGVDSYMFGSHGSPAFVKPFNINDVIYDPFDPVHLFSEELNVNWVKDPAQNQESGTPSASSTVPCGPGSSIEKHVNENDIMEKFQLFKQFDTVQDHSDHRYSCIGSSGNQPSKNWAKKIQEEWKILEKDLPDTIFVRVYESRMDLLRAVIVGAEGTPYHDGLFFFDVFFPCGYPNVPPHVYYHSGGLRINPNLYDCGKVCLSLLNTWSGSQNEMWIPGVSTMLQVLVSIQGLILNEKPYFNEPGFASMSGSASGEVYSQQYNENAFILSLKTMVYTIRRPPKHFEDFVFGHFCKRAHDILAACKLRTDGAQVSGCLPKGGVQDVVGGDKSIRQHFQNPLAGCIPLLVQTFSQIGAKDCDKFLPLAPKGNSQASSMPMVANYC